jgi:TRAP-type transport system periplasmic protein
MAKQTIKWVVAHEPLELFLRVLDRFQEEVSKRTDDIEIECLTLETYAEKYNDGKEISYFDLLELMNNGVIEMAQTNTSVLGGHHNRDLWAIEMPFIFRDHDHATRVFEGEIGKKMLNDIGKESNIKGLAFTYSGGFRMLPANKEVNSIEDLEGMTVRTTRCAVAEETFRAVGAIPVPMSLSEITKAVKINKIEAGESTYPRYYALKQNEALSVINDTKHSLFTTNILISKEFWNSMDKETQDIVQDAAMVAAADERQESIDDIQRVTDQCVIDDVKIVDLNDVETIKFKEATAYLYDKFEDMFSADLLNKIKNA